MKHFLYLILFFLTSCAQQTTLTGGSKDVTPPKLDSVKTDPAPLTTYFNGNKVELVFNENIQLNNGKRNLISNPNIYNIESNVNKNKLIVSWEDSLSINTTYQLYFPNSISDITEKNAISSFSYVFSTGNQIESGKYNGKIIEMPNLQKGENYLVFLRHISDTLLNYKTYSKTDGTFEFDFIKSGNYYVGGFNDKNNNFLLDSLTETVFFNTDTINIISDSLMKGEHISFGPIQKVNIEKSSLNQYGRINIEFNQIVDSCIVYDTISQVSFLSDKKSKKHTFFMKDTLDKYFLIVSTPKQNFKKKIILADTEKKSKKNQLTFKENQEENWIASQDYKLHFNQFLKAIDTNKINLYQNSIKLNGYYAFLGEKLTVAPSLIGNFKLILLPESLIGLKSTKKDTSIIHFTIKADDKLGELDLIIDSLAPSNYILNVIKNDKIVEEILFRGSQFKKKFTRCEPGNYKLKIIQDLDRNKYWSTGNIFLLIQPEKIFHYSGEVIIKKNWTTSIKWILNSSL